MPRERRERAMPGARGRPARRSSRNLGGDVVLLRYALSDRFGMLDGQGAEAGRVAAEIP